MPRDVLRWPSGSALGSSPSPPTSIGRVFVLPISSSITGTTMLLSTASASASSSSVASRLPAIVSTSLTPRRLGRSTASIV